MVIHSWEKEVAVILKWLGRWNDRRVRKHVDFGIEGDKSVIEIIESHEDHLKFGSRIGRWLGCRGGR